MNYSRPTGLKEPVLVRECGRRAHEELWVPAEELEDFNKAIVGTIEVIGGYRAKRPLAREEAQRLVERA